MFKLIQITTISLLIAACGGDKKEVETKEEAKSTIETEAVKTSEPVAAPKTNAENTPIAIIDKQSAIDEAKMITKAFGTELKGELQAAMKAGGPINALDVCHTKAMEITAKASEQQNAQVSRVSLKNRNPINVPNDWQKAVLEDFDARAAKGEDIATMAFAEIVENGDKKQLHFMKALPTEQVCLGCHGANLAPEVQAKLAELYPADKATGYELGQVRGAVVVQKNLN